MKSALVIHGHFYQPPRENPWTQVVEREPSAAPAHNWNERVHHECYRANAFARIFDGDGRVTRIHDNYEWMSFNFGPTLLSWMETHDPATYARVLDADRKSLARLGGHGNAIAQGFNHAILPLCSERDRRTQIRWGILDFERRFGRTPEALWLPETACDDATLEALIDERLRFAILSPYQAERVRKIGTSAWTDVGSGTIDPGQPYLYTHRDGSGRTIAIFFYDGPISRAIAFEGALASSQAFVGRFRQAHGGPSRLVHVATDGESYGHHTKHGDRTLAHTLAHEASAHGFDLVSYGAFLARHPPTMEVEIKRGPNGEGTAWSCAHGVGRWYRDCGCSTGAPAGWNQAWRGPLRRALDLLRDEVAAHFEETQGELFRDPWAARDDYLAVMNATTAEKEAWLTARAPRAQRARDRERSLTHLELQHNALLMYTSCGWFFADVSGIETVQVMKYAQRALDLLDELDLPSPRDRFLEVLAEARSNLPDFGNGADVFRRFVDPLRVFPARIAAHALMTNVVEEAAPSGIVARYRMNSSNYRKERHGRLIMATSHVELEDRATERRHEFGVAAMHFGGADFYCVVRPSIGIRQFSAAAAKLWANFRTASLPILLRTAQEELGPDEFGLDSVLPEGRLQLSGLVFGTIVENFAEQYARLHEGNERVLEMLQDAGLEMPKELRSAAEFTFSRRFDAAIRHAAGSEDPEAYAPALRIAEEAERRGFAIDHSTTEPIVAELVARAVGRALTAGRKSEIEAVSALVRRAKKLGLATGLGRAQEVYDHAVAAAGSSDAVSGLGAELGFSRSYLEMRRKPTAEEPDEKEGR